jgi:hypothetical protein
MSKEISGELVLLGGRHKLRKAYHRWGLEGIFKNQQRPLYRQT